jgi:hypothetical protein
MRKLPVVLVAMSSALIANVASAQVPEENATTMGIQTMGAQSAVGTPPPGQSGPLDHDTVVRHVGLHYFGAPSVMLLDATGMSSTETPVPTIGVRYWFGDRMGIEAGLGFGYAGASQSVTGGGMVSITNQPSVFGIGLQAGLPIVLAYYKHVNFFVSPFLGFYYGNSGHTVMPSDPTSYVASTVRFNLGAQAAAEVSLGMIGLPQVSIEARFGLQLGVTSHTIEVANAGNVTSLNRTEIGFGTTVGNFALRDLLVSSLAATYYF